jgi:hypothetical protein
MLLGQVKEKDSSEKYFFNAVPIGSLRSSLGYNLIINHKTTTL